MQGIEIFPYPAPIDTQKLVATGGHVDVVRLTLRPFSVEELEHRVIGRGFLEQDGHEDKEGFAQFR